MSYDLDDYTIDGRRLVAGSGLAGMALLGLIVIGCPATPAASPLQEKACYRHGVVSQAGCIQGLASVERHLVTTQLLAA